MADPIDIDPTRDDTGAAEGGAAGGGDDDPQDYNLPGGPTDSPEEQRRKWYQRGAIPKNPRGYKPLPREDEGIHMSEFPKEKSGLPEQEGDPSGRVMITAEQVATKEVEQDFPFMDHNRVEVRYSTTGRRTGAIIEIKMRNTTTKWYPLLTKTRGDDEKTFNTNLPKEIQSALDPYRGVQIKDAEIQQKDVEIEEIKKTKQENQQVADDENEQPEVRARACDKVTDDTEREKPGRTGQRTT